jgi:hypothetical protein
MSQNAPVSETLQAATTISKTAQTLIGKVVAVGGYEYITLFFTYVKGDETGVTLIPSVMQSATGTAHPFMEWSAAAGAKTRTASNFALTASANGYITLDVRGIAYIMFTQGGTANDGTPTGTLAVSYSLK